MERRVVVTGIGLRAPLSFEAIVAGECGLRVPADEQLAASCGRAGLVPGETAAAVKALPGGWKPDRLDPVAHYALLAAHTAREDSGLTGDGDLESAAVVVASAMGGERTHYNASRDLTAHHLTGSRFRVSPFTAPKLMPNASSAVVSMLLGAHGYNVSPAAACASGAYALAQALDLIRLGRAEVAVAGASEAPCEEIAARVFSAGEALSPTGDSLPFNPRRNGFVLAEGAAVLVLEELGHAQQRGARIYAELAGAGLSADAYHVVAPDPDGRYAARAMQEALREAGITPDEVGYVNAHATGTPIGDLSEVRALASVFGEHRPAVSSTKGATGHLLGAAGALEAVYCVLALHQGRIPPTLGLADGELDSECAALGFDFVTDANREASIRVALSNSFAFGGHNAALCFRRWVGE